MDTALLESRVSKKLEKSANEVRKQGWKWVEIHPAFDHSEWLECECRFPEASPLPPEEQAELEKLMAGPTLLTRATSLTKTSRRGSIRSRSASRSRNRLRSGRGRFRKLDGNIRRAIVGHIKESRHGDQLTSGAPDSVLRYVVVW
jgi:hypothetical protein